MNGDELTVEGRRIRLGPGVEGLSRGRDGFVVRYRPRRFATLDDAVAAGAVEEVGAVRVIWSTRRTRGAPRLHVVETPLRRLARTRGGTEYAIAVRCPDTITIAERTARMATRLEDVPAEVRANPCPGCFTGPRRAWLEETT